MTNLRNAVFLQRRSVAHLNWIPWYHCRVTVRPTCNRVRVTAVVGVTTCGQGHTRLAIHPRPADRRSSLAASRTAAGTDTAAAAADTAAQ